MISRVYTPTLNACSIANAAASHEQAVNVYLTSKIVEALGLKHTQFDASWLALRTVPLPLWSLVSLQELILRSNLLLAIPEECSRLERLAVLDISDNDLLGSLHRITLFD